MTREEFVAFLVLFMYNVCIEIKKEYQEKIIIKPKEGVRSGLILAIYCGE